jgi:hypothetical protein
MARTRVSTRFWIESALAASSALFGLLTLFWKDWIEVVSGVDPDRHSGALEWLIVIACALAATVFALLARFEWRRGERAVSAGSS